MLNLYHINKRYYQNKKLIFSLKDINISFLDKGLYSIIGPSGSGKSTLLSIIIGLEKPDEGYLEYNGERITNYEQFRKNNIGILFQNYNLLDDYDGSFNYQLPLLYDELQDNGKIYKNFNIDEEMLCQKANNLSGGEKQRLALCRALSRNPSIIVADEPTGSLDYDNGIRLMKTLSTISKNNLVIVVTHDRTLANKYSDYIVSIDDGRISQITTLNRRKSHFDFKHKTKKYDKDSAIYTVKKRIFSNKIKFLCLVFAMFLSIFSSSTSFLINNNISSEIKAQHENYIDYNVVSISKQKIISSDETRLKTVQVIRPTINELYGIKKHISFIDYGYDFSALLKPTLYDLNYNKISTNIKFSPLFDIKNLNYNEAICNNIFKELYDEDELILKIKVNIRLNEKIEVFSMETKVKIVDMKSENRNLNSPTLFYNYYAYEKYLNDLYVNDVKSWLSIIKDANDFASVTNYSMLLYLEKKDIVNLNKLTNNISLNGFYYKITNNAININNALRGVEDTMSIVCKLLIFLSLVSFSLIIIVASYADIFSYRKESAIKEAVGIKSKYIFKEFLLKNTISLFISSIASLILNAFLTNYTKSINIFNIKFSNLFLGYLPSLIIFTVIAFILITLFTLISYLLCSRHIYEELRNE